MGIFADRVVSIAFFSFLLFGATCYHIKKAKQQAKELNNMLRKSQLDN